jgi:hypothetical protein
MKAAKLAIAVLSCFCLLAICLLAEHLASRRTSSLPMVLVDRAVHKLSWSYRQIDLSPGTYHYITELYGQYPGRVMTTVYWDGKWCLRAVQQESSCVTVCTDGRSGWYDLDGVVSHLSPTQCRSALEGMAVISVADLLSAYEVAPKSAGWKQLPNGPLAEAVRFQRRGVGEVEYYFDPGTGLPIAASYPFTGAGGSGNQTLLVRYRFVLRKNGYIPCRRDSFLDGKRQSIQTLESQTDTVPAGIFTEPKTITCSTVTSIPFHQVDSLPIVTVVLNRSYTCRLVIDTGCNGIVLSSEAARRLGLKLGPWVQDSLAVEHADSRIAELRSLQLAGIELTNLPVTVSSAPAGDTHFGRVFDGLLGYEVLGHYQVTLDYKNEILRLSPRSAAPPKGSSVKFDIDNGAILAPVSADAADVRAMIDTGSPDSFFNSSAAAAARLPAGGNWVTARLASLGLVVNSTYEAHLHRISIGGQTVRDYPLLCRRGDEMFGLREIRGLIGSTFLTHFAVTFDFYRQQLILAGASIPQPSTPAVGGHSHSKGGPADLTRVTRTDR